MIGIPLGLSDITLSALQRLGEQCCLILSACDFNNLVHKPVYLLELLKFDINVTTLYMKFE